MLKLLIVRFPLLVLLICVLAVVGCESSQQMHQNHSPVNNSRAPTGVTIVKTIEDNEGVAVLRGRVKDAYKQLLPFISVEHQVELLPVILRDPMEEVRIVGIERVGVLIRDGKAPKDVLRLVVDLLSDKKSTVRLAAAELLPEIHLPDVAHHVADALETEHNPEVLAKLLSFFVSQPNLIAINPTVKLLSTQAFNSAATTLIELFDKYREQCSDELLTRVLKIVQAKRRRSKNNTSLITLEAMLGGQEIQNKLLRWSERKDETIQRAVMEGLAYDGYVEPLIKQPINPKYFDLVFRSFQKRGGIQSFEQLMYLQDKITIDADSDSWNFVVITIATKLNTEDFFDADKMLKRKGLYSLRVTILKQILSHENKPEPIKLESIVLTLVPLLLNSGDTVEALQVFEVFGENMLNKELLTLKFDTAIKAHEWDAAADTNSDVDLWISKYKTINESDTGAASAMKTEIKQRFDLTPEQLELLGIAPKSKTAEKTP